MKLQLRYNKHQKRAKIIMKEFADQWNETNDEVTLHYDRQQNLLEMCVHLEKVD